MRCFGLLLVYCVFVALNFLGLARADGIKLDTVEGCDINPDNDSGDMTESGWSTLTTEAPYETNCVFSLIDKNRKSYPIINLNGKKIKLQLITKIKKNGKWTDYYIYMSVDRSIKVELSTKLNRDTCLENTEGCCGQEYKGKLIVTRKSLSKEYLVYQWHGS